jgi:hypothetical protein
MRLVPVKATSRTSIAKDGDWKAGLARISWGDEFKNENSESISSQSRTNIKCAKFLGPQHQLLFGERDISTQPENDESIDAMEFSSASGELRRF